MMQSFFLRGRAICAIAAIAVLAGCASSTSPTPTPPTPSAPVGMASVAPSAPIRSSTVQVLTVAGNSFRAGLVLRITNPLGLATTVPSADIRNLSSSSFEASVTLPTAGLYLIVVQQLDGETSGSFSLNVVTAAGSGPHIESVSPAQTIVDDQTQQVSLIGSGFDLSLTVRMVGPDNVQTEIRAEDFTIEANSIIQFVLVLSKTGTYTFSLWNGNGRMSNFADLIVR